MILDHENLFSKGQAITATAVSEDIVDLGPNSWAHNSQGGGPIPILVSVDEAFTAGESATLTIEVETSNTEGSGYEVSHRTAPIPVDDLVVEGIVNMALHIPPDSGRYVRLNYVVASGPMTAGKLTAGVVAARQTNR